MSHLSILVPDDPPFPLAPNVPVPGDDWSRFRCLFCNKWGRLSPNATAHHRENLTRLVCLICLTDGDVDLE